MPGVVQAAIGCDGGDVRIGRERAQQRGSGGRVERTRQRDHIGARAMRRTWRTVRPGMRCGDARTHDGGARGIERGGRARALHGARAIAHDETTLRCLAVGAGFAS